jgi:hypothetical protein
MKFVEPRPFANPDLAARELVEIANGVEAVGDVGGRFRHGAQYSTRSMACRPSPWLRRVAHQRGANRPPQVAPSLMSVELVAILCLLSSCGPSTI